MRSKIVIRAVIGAVPLVLLAACSSGGGKGGVVTITVPASSPPAASGSPSGSTAASGSGPASSASSSPAVLTKLPGTCASLLPDYTVTQALGGTQLAGKDQFVVGEPEKDIGRLAYINCRYGVTGSGGAATAKVEIGVSLYTNQAKAAERVRATVQDYEAHGASASAAVVAGVNGSFLSGGTGADYDQPLLVATGGQRTVAVTVDESVAAGDEAVTRSRTLATLALRVTSK